MRKTRTKALISLSFMVALATSALAGPTTALAADESNPRDSIVYLEGGVSVSDMWVAYGSQTASFVGVDGEDPSYLVTDDHLLSTFEYFGSGKHVNVPVGKDGETVTGNVALRAYRDEIVRAHV